MFLNGTFLGVSYYGNTNQIPLPKEYSGIKINGKAIFNNIRVINRVLTDEEINNIQLSDIPFWSPETILLAKFENTINAGNVVQMDNPILKWEINRKELGGTTLKKLATVDTNVYEYTDWTTQGNKSYTYNIFPLTNNEVGEALETETVTTDYFGWYLIDEELGICYEFDLNLQSGEMSNEVDFVEFKNYTKYSSFAIGDRDYMKGTISAIVGDITVNGQLDQSVDYLDDLRAFINNGNEKILKSRKGAIYHVMTTNYRQSILDDGIKEQPMTVSFDFIESSEV